MVEKYLDCGSTWVVAILPILRDVLVLGSPHLVTFLTQDKNHAHRTQRRRNDKDQNSALQRVYHPRASRSGLSITEGTTLRESGQRHCKARHREQRNQPRITSF